MTRRKFRAIVLAFFSAVCVFTGMKLGAQQGMDAQTTAEAQVVLQQAHDFVVKYYYDPKFHGLDWDARYRDYEDKVKNAGSLSQAFGVIASFLGGLDDSHTFFNPPTRPFRVDYGFRMEIVGDDCFIWQVRPDTDAAQKIRPGEQVLSYNEFAENRAEFWKLEYYFGDLAPLKATILALRDPTGEERTVTVEAKVQELKKVVDVTGLSNNGDDVWDARRRAEKVRHYNRQRHVEKGDVMIWKMPLFDIENGEVDHLFGIARKHGALVLDMRGNPGGADAVLDRMLDNVFDHEVKIADRVTRKGTKPEFVKGRGHSAYVGKLIVLLDASSASAAELFARVVQIEKRGVVVGDHSSGKVMEALRYPASQGSKRVIFYSFMITEANLIMSDGKSLEHMGVTPDEIVLPTAEDLALGRDPALSRAAELAGIKLDPVEAGRLFPFEWMPL